MIKARISSPIKAPTQSGQNKQYWLVEYITNKPARFLSKDMKWTGSTDMQEEVKLKFASCEEAVSFVKKNNIPYEIIDKPKHKIIKKNYADNFK